MVTSFLCTVLVVLPGCAAPEDLPPLPIGSPLPFLTPEQLARFQGGEALFNRVFTAQQGIGPLFNENQCSACHTFPASGGTGEQKLIRATRFTPPGQCDALSAQGGENVRTQVTPALRAQGITHQPLPAAATERGEFTVPFLFGLGLIEAIPEETILSRADPEDRDGDGISGRPGRDATGKLGRFGRKLELAQLSDFIDTALRFEMGLTTPAHPIEPSPFAQPFPAASDPAPDPEVNAQTLTLLTDFVRFLAPPSRRARQSAEERQNVQRGEELFHRAGCDLCHVPAMRTGSNDVSALDQRRVFLYSDLLLHDLGPALANVCGIAATPTEHRTALLMGVSERQQLLSNGRALTLHQAILLHGGEAELAKQRFRNLNEVEQQRLIDFLRTL
ncbi:MAG: di-heme oxidoredictase family protein [Longimicrobiales bacterium]